nr:hypothetical protein [uncultured Mediterraneibacter sp.]
MSKKGRRRKPDAKRKGANFRVNDNQLNMLNAISETTGKSKTDIFVDLVSREYERIKKEA